MLMGTSMTTAATSNASSSNGVGNSSQADYFYYFAFGSNLLRERVSINSPTAVFVTTAKLEGRDADVGQVFEIL